MVDSFRKQQIRSDSSKPSCVVISDVHYSLQNLELSDKAFRAAIDKAAELNIPLIDCGDLTNDKAILRAEVVNALILTMKYAKSKKVDVLVLVGNHSLINEKSTEHALNFLNPWCTVVNTPTSMLGFHFIPYQSSPQVFIEHLNEIPKGSTILCHQGVPEAFMGDYIQDHSAVSTEHTKDYTVFSGHYHKHQSIGSWTYIGNPYTMSFGESNDGPKGFLILNDDNTFTRKILDLRKHIKIETTVENLQSLQPVRENDLVWIKLSGPRSELHKVKKEEVAALLKVKDFKLDLIPTDLDTHVIEVEKMTNLEILDTIIDALPDEDEHKKYLKELYLEVIKS
jgi:hypothetical protein